jgi:hypothetical protein
MDDEGDALVMERKPRAPGERAEPAVAAAAKLPQLEHLHLRKVRIILSRTFNESSRLAPGLRASLRFNCSIRNATRDANNEPEDR